MPALRGPRAGLNYPRNSRVRSALCNYSAGLKSKLSFQGDLCLKWIEWLDTAEEVRVLTDVERSLRPNLKSDTLSSVFKRRLSGNKDLEFISLRKAMLIRDSSILKPVAAGIKIISPNWPMAHLCATPTLLLRLSCLPSLESNLGSPILIGRVSISPRSFLPSSRIIISLTSRPLLRRMK